MSRKVITRFNPATEEQHTTQIDGQLPFEALLGQMAIAGGRYYLSMQNHGLFVGDATLQHWEPLEQFGNIISSLRSCDGQRLCVGTNGSGAYLIDGATAAVVEHFGTQEIGTHLLPSDGVYFYQRDRLGIDWIGFSRYGLAHSYRIRSLFEPFSIGNFTTDGHTVSSVFIDGDQMLMGTFDGFCNVDRRSGQVHIFPAVATGGGAIVRSFARWQGEYYVGSYDGGVSIFNPQTLTVRRPDGSPYLRTTSVGSIVVAPDSTLWVGTGDGLFVIDRQGVTTRYTEQNSHICGGNIGFIFFDRQGDALLGSNGGSGNSVALWSARSRVFDDRGLPTDFWSTKKLRWGFKGHDSLYFASDLRSL